MTDERVVRVVIPAQRAKKGQRDPAHLTWPTQKNNQLAILPKNRPACRECRRPLGHPVLISSTTKSTGKKRQIQHLVQEAMGSARVLWPDDDVEVDVVWRWVSHEVEVQVRSLGPPKKVGGATGRVRDLSNFLDLLLDALEQSAYSNDNQVARIVMTKVAE